MSVAAGRCITRAGESGGDQSWTPRPQVALAPQSVRIGPVERAVRSTSKSAISRRFVAATKTALAELLAAYLSRWIWSR